MFETSLVKVIATSAEPPGIREISDKSAVITFLAGIAEGQVTTTSAVDTVLAGFVVMAEILIKDVAAKLSAALTFTFANAPVAPVIGSPVPLTKIILPVVGLI